MFRVEKQLDNQITITLNSESTLTLHSILEYFTRADDIEDKANDTELNMANTLSEELLYYIKDNLSEQIDSEVIQYINDSYK